MEKIKMPVPIAELDGDEMTHILWGMIKEQLICPFVELNTEYYDLSLPNRDKTEDAVTQPSGGCMSALSARPLRPTTSGRRNTALKSFGDRPTPPSARRSTARCSARRYLYRG